MMMVVGVVMGVGSRGLERVAISSCVIPAPRAHSRWDVCTVGRSSTLGIPHLIGLITAGRPSSSTVERDPGWCFQRAVWMINTVNIQKQELI